MAATRAFTLVLAGFLGLLLAALVVLPVRAEEEASADGDGIAVLCEAWRVTAPRVVNGIETITERDPGAAAEVRALLRDGGARRLARLLTPATHGEIVLFSDLRQVPQVVQTVTTGGKVASGFSGYQEVGAQLQLTPWDAGDGVVKLDLELRVSSPGAQPDDGPARSRTSTQIQTTIEVPLGAWRMFLSRAADDDVVVVFVRASALGTRMPIVDEVGAFSEAEIERFSALRRIVEDRERAWRYRELYGRQLERLDLELTDEQRETVLDLTITYRNRVRETGLSIPRGDREAMQTAMDALRQDYAESLAAVLDAEAVEKVLQVVGSIGRARADGFGRER